MTSRIAPVLIEKDNLSHAWAEVVLKILPHSGTMLSPLMLSITGFDEVGMAAEDAEIRKAAEAILVAEGKRDIENVAFTIFPQRYLAIVGGDRKALYDLYRDAFKRIQSYNRRNNARGSYFQRLIDFRGDGKVNQLEWMLEEYESSPNRRRTKFQAAIFDPSRDPTSSPYMEFPCLQGISFDFDDKESLVLNAFYPTQQMITKGYGNYLGLSQLGAFMAGQMQRQFVRLNVFVGIAKAEPLEAPKEAIETFIETLRARTISVANMAEPA